MILDSPSQDIKAATKIPDGDLARSLQSLACGKFRILTKNPKGRDVGPNDNFSFNSGFTCPLAKIKIQTIVGKVENNEERAETQERVDEERKHQIEVSLLGSPVTKPSHAGVSKLIIRSPSAPQACIVRIMKARKTLSHNELVAEVVRQLMTRFTPTPAIIKKRIEGLIDVSLERGRAGFAQNSRPDKGVLLRRFHRESTLNVMT
jgi:cullin 3